MKKVKISMALGAAVLTLIGTVGTAFKTTRASNFHFTRVGSGIARSQAQADYKYQPTGACTFSTTTTCLATWAQNTTPSQGAQPNSTAIFVQTVTNGKHS